MRILYHHRTLGDGAEGIHIREMVHAFRGLGHEVRVIGPVGEATPQTSGKPGRLAAIKRCIPGPLFELAEMGYTLWSLARTVLEVWRFRPHFIYDRYITFNAGPVLAGRLCRLPVLLEMNAPLALERSEQKDETLFFRRIARGMERWIAASASRTIVVSTPLKSYLESIGVPGERCVVMPNGVDPQRFKPQLRNAALAEELRLTGLVVGFTGVLREWHGLDLLLNAVASAIRSGLNVSLLIVGDGPYRGTIELMARELGIDHVVRITGLVPHARVPEYISLFDVAVSPRATFYASPMKVLEYMALGKAVLVPGTPNFLDMMDDGVNGLTFEDGSCDAMRGALARLYADPELCTRLGARARRKVEERLNWRWNAVRSCELATEISVSGARVAE